MVYNKKRMVAVLLSLLIMLSTTGCAKAATDNNGESQVEVQGLNGSEMFTGSDKEIAYDEGTAISVALSDVGTQADSNAVKIADNIVTITDEGTYVLSGSLTNGQVIVEAEKTDKVRLVLNGVSLNSDTSAALYVKQADKVFVTLARGTENNLSNKSEFVAVDENSIDSVIFSKDDLTLNGEGTLEINAAYGHGVVSKDDLVITSGTYHITAASHALSGNDSVRIADGSFTLSSGKDGIKADNTEDTTLGFVYIADGRFAITSSGDGISSSGNLIFNGGNVVIDSADDALHSNTNIVIKDGEFTLSTGDDGVHGDANVTISGGNLTVEKSYEGIEGQSIDITDGIISVTASDDGLNSAGGNDQSDITGGRGKDSFASDENAYIKISGGKLNVNASGDGIDSNGNLYVSGGETYVSGPTNSGNGALDYNGDAQITGGIFIAIGASGMSQNFGESSTQGTILVTLSGNQEKGEILLKDGTGKTVLSYAPVKSYGSVVISCPQIKEGKSYTLETGSQSTSIEMTSFVYGIGGGMGGGPGGGKGQRPLKIIFPPE